MAWTLTILTRRLPSASLIRSAGIFLMLLAVGSGQELVARIMLPDSAGVAGTGQLAAYDTLSNKTFFCGRGGAGVLSGPLGRRVRRIELDGFYYHSQSMVLYPALRKVYAAAAYDTTTYVIDADREVVVNSIPIPRPRTNVTMGMENICVNWQDDKLYVNYHGPESDYGIAVYDIHADTLLHTIAVAPGSICYNRTNNKLYVKSLGGNYVHIFDAKADTFIGTVSAGSGATSVGWLERWNKVYVNNFFGASVTVIDGAGDSVICTIPTPVGPRRPVMNEVEGKVYVGTDEGGAIIDGAGDTIRVLVPANRIAGVGWNPATNKVYWNYKGGAKVICGKTDSVLKDIPMPVWASYVSCNTRDNIIYFAGDLDWDMLALDGEADTVLWYEFVGRRPGVRASAWSPRNRRLYTASELGRDVLEIALDPEIPRRRSVGTPCKYGYPYNRLPVFDSTHAKLYMTDTAGDTLSVVSCSTMQAIRYFTLPDTTICRFGQSVSIGRHNRLYAVINREAGYLLAVIDTRNDSLLRYDTLPDTVTCNARDGKSAYSPVSDKWYAAGVQGYLIAFDAASGRFLRHTKITRGHGVSLGHMLWHSSSNRLYVATTEDLKVFDCETDSVVATIPVPFLHRMVYNPQEDRIYASVDQSLNFLVIDCRTNQVYTTLRFPGLPRNMSEPAPVYNPLSNRVYVPAKTGGTGQLQPVHWLVAIDCATNQIHSWHKIGYEPYTLDADPDSGYVMAACHNSALYVIRDQSPGLAEAPRARPASRLQLQVKPTPALGGVTITCTLPRTERARLGVYDAAGRLVSLLVDDEIGPGRVELVWDARDGLRRAAAGTYIVRLQAAGETLARKMVVPAH